MKMCTKKRWFPNLLGFIILLSSMVFFLNTQSAHALATLKLSDGTTTIIVSDGGAGDSNPATGAITYNDTNTVFSFASVFVSTGVTYPLTGTIDYPILHMDSIAVTGAGTLEVFFSETGFGPTGLKPFKSDIAGIAGYSVTGRTYVDGSNTLFGTSTPLATFGPSGAGSLSGSGTTFFDPIDPYSLTTIATITHNASNQVSSVNLQVAVVPEPVSSTLFIIGSALLGIKVYRNKRIKA